MSNRPLIVLALALISLVVAMAFGAFGTYFGQPGMPEDAVTYAEWARRDTPVFVPAPESTPVAKAPAAVPQIYPEPNLLQQPATGIELELVDGRTGEAAGGATVDLLPYFEKAPSFFTYAMVKEGQVPTPEKLSLSLRFVADATGIVRLPLLTEERFVVATLDGAEGYSWYGGGREAGPRGSEGRPLRIVLRERKDLVINVVDQVGEPVAERRIYLDGRMGDKLAWVETDEEGSFTIFHANTLAAAIQEGRDGAETALELSIKPLDLPEGRATVDLVELSNDPVVLVVRRSGLLTVRVLSEDGEDLEWGTVGVKFVQPGIPDSERYPSARGSRPLVFDELIPGAPFRLDWYSVMDDRSGDGVEGIVPGPLDPPVEIEMRAPIEFGCFARARLVDESGRALANRVVTTHMQMFDSGMTSHTGGYNRRTDDEGRLMVDLDDRLRDGDGRCVILLAFTVKNEGGATLFSDMPRFQGKLKGGPAELGDVVMKEGELLLAGQLVDQQGAPVVGAELELEVSTQWPAIPLEGQAISGMPIPRQDSAPTDLEGRFEVRGLSRANEHYLVVDSPNYTWDGVKPFPKGKTDAKVTADPTGSLVGSIPEGANNPRKYHTIYITPQDPDKRARFNPGVIGSGTKSSRDGWVGTGPSPTGEFGWTGLSPGRYSVRYGESYIAEEAYLVEDLLVVAGEITADPRLQEGLTAEFGE